MGSSGGTRKAKASEVVPNIRRHRFVDPNQNLRLKANQRERTKTLTIPGTTVAEQSGRKRPKKNPKKTRELIWEEKAEKHTKQSSECNKSIFPSLYLGNKILRFVDRKKRKQKASGNGLSGYRRGGG
jgi:hypothetical protein